MLSNSHRYVQPYDEMTRLSLEASIREDFARCHPDITLEDLKRRAAFSKEDRGLLRDWMAIAARKTS
ncbi:MAG: hypothetical protein J0H40_01605 [Rhizobiales bacterium]|nr:hypothetical protein [Hyphomicrobiales bacterium]